MLKIFAHYISREDGATAIEYGLIGASIAVAVAAVAFIIGDEIDGTFNFVLTSLQS